MRLGQPLWKRSEHDRWYYWLGDKQGYPTGSVLAKSARDARSEIKILHPGAKVDCVLHQSQYHG